MAIPFPAPQGGHLLGQPFTLSNLSIPVSGLLTCNCGLSDSPTLSLNGQPVQCTGCRKTYIVFVNPQNGQLQVAVTAPEAEKVPS